jgi:hypothetical protein
MVNKSERKIWVGHAAYTGKPKCIEILVEKSH